MSISSLQRLWDAEGLGARAGAKTTPRVLTISGKTVKVIDDDPSELAASAGVDVETYALARALTSEGYDGQDKGRAAAAVAMGYTIQRLARGQVAKKALASQYAEANGRFGSQIGRAFATTIDPKAFYLEVAKAVRQSTVADMSRGAVQFFSPRVQNGGTQGGNSISSASEILEKWHASNAFIGRDAIPTVDDYELMFLRPESDSTKRRIALQEALVVNELGLAKKNRPAPGNPDGGGSGVLVALALFAGLRFLG